MDINLLDPDLAEHRYQLVHGAKERALELAPTSIDQAHDLADRLHARYVEHRPALESEARPATRQRVERTLEHKAKRFPVDTPLDRRRRQRTRWRGVTGAIVLLSLLGAAAYLRWRRRHDPVAAPDLGEASSERPDRPAGASAPAEGRDVARRPAHRRPP